MLTRNGCGYLTPATSFIHAKFNACKQYIAHSGSFKFHRLILMTNNKLYNPTQTLTQTLYVKHLDHNYALHLYTIYWSTLPSPTRMEQPRYLLTSLALNDFAIGLLITPFGILPALFHCWPYGEIYCQIQVIKLMNTTFEVPNRRIEENNKGFWNNNGISPRLVIVKDFKMKLIGTKILCYS